MAVFFGSQTGTAEGFARTIAKEVGRLICVETPIDGCG